MIIRGAGTIFDHLIIRKMYKKVATEKQRPIHGGTANQIHHGGAASLFFGVSLYIDWSGV